MTKQLVKQDINCLEYPLWFQDDRFAEHHEDGYTWKNAKGFVFSTSFKPPVKTDIVFLLYLLNQSQKEGWKDEIKLTRYQVIKECGLTRNIQWYDRLEESLKRWERVSIEFNGCFYDGKAYKTIHFGVVDSWSIEEGTKLLRIRFSPEYLLVVKNTKYFRYIDFDQIKALRSSLATRLYQLLIKTFLERPYWETDSVLLAEKIPMKERYPAQIVKKIKPAVKRIYNHTDLKVTVEERKKGRGEIVLVFRREAAKPKENLLEKKSPPFVMPENEDFKKLVSMLPPERQRQKSLLELVSKAFTENGFDFVAWNIRYANKRAIGNYPAYFLKSLQGNFGAVMQEEAEVSQVAASKKTEEAKAKHVKIAEAEAKEKQESARVQEFLKSLTPGELEAVELEAYEKIPRFMKKPTEDLRKANHISFRSFVRLVALEKLNAMETAPTAPQQLELAEGME